MELVFIREFSFLVSACDDICSLTKSYTWIIPAKDLFFKLLIVLNGCFIVVQKVYK